MNNPTQRVIGTSYRLPYQRGESLSGSERVWHRSNSKRQQLRDCVYLCPTHCTWNCRCLIVAGLRRVTCAFFSLPHSFWANLNVETMQKHRSALGKVGPSHTNWRFFTLSVQTFPHSHLKSTEKIGFPAPMSQHATAMLLQTLQEGEQTKKQKMC